MREPCLLALDTATERLCVAVARGANAVFFDEVLGAQASSRLIEQAQRLLALLDCTWADLDAIAFGAGPGAFTGLRTACAVAQGAALGLDKPVLAIDSLAIVAEDARQQAHAHEQFSCWVAMDARMDEIYAAAYEWNTGTGWRVAQAPALWTLPALLDHWQPSPPVAVAGSALKAFGDRLALPANVPQWPTETARAAALMRLAQAQWRDGATIDPALALPVYLRDKVAQTTAERAAAKAQAAGSGAA